MTEILSLGKSRYLGDINYIRELGGLTASAVAAVRPEPGDDALHYHENPIVSFILEGDSLETINHRPNHRSAGDLRFYRAGDLHQVKIEKYPSRNINFELDHRFLTSYGISESALGNALEKNAGTKLIFLYTFHELYANDALSETAILMLFHNLTGPAAGRKTPAWLETLRELLNDRWSEHLSLDELARAMNVHPVTISKYFTRYFDCTYGEYMRRLRITKSLPLIKNSQLSLTEIAFQCGFSDQSHFTRNFKRLTGLTPKNFKKF